jgi:hypothetical protein
MQLRLSKSPSLGLLLVVVTSAAPISREQSLLFQRFFAMKDKVYDEAGQVSAEDGIVHVDGPDGVDVHLTPDAALDISDQILNGALTARGQQSSREHEEARRAALHREMEEAASQRASKP